MQRILFAESVITHEFIPQAFSSSGTGEDLVKEREKTAVVHICMGDENGFLHAVEIGQDAPEYGQHFFTVAGVSAVHKQYLIAAFDDDRIASARRLDQRDFRIVCDFMCADSRRERCTLGCAEEFCKLADAVEGSVGRESLLIQRLHGQIDMNQQFTAYLIGKSHCLGKPHDIGVIENAVVVYLF